MAKVAKQIYTKAEAVKHGSCTIISNWVIDSGASAHMSPFLSDFVHGKMVSVSKIVQVADEYETPCNHKGQTHPLQMTSNNGKTVTAKMEHVLYVPTLNQHLMSVPCLTRSGHGVFFGDHYIRVYFGQNMDYPVTISSDATGLTPFLAQNVDSVPAQPTHDKLDRTRPEISTPKRKVTLNS